MLLSDYYSNFFSNNNWNQSKLWKLLVHIWLLATSEFSKSLYTTHPFNSLLLLCNVFFCLWWNWRTDNTLPVFFQYAEDGDCWLLSHGTVWIILTSMELSHHSKGLEVFIKYLTYQKLSPYRSCDLYWNGGTFPGSWHFFRVAMMTNYYTLRDLHCIKFAGWYKLL